MVPDDSPEEKPSRHSSYSNSSNNFSSIPSNYSNASSNGPGARLPISVTPEAPPSHITAPASPPSLQQHQVRIIIFKNFMVKYLNKKSK